MTESKLKVPHTLVLLFAMVILGQVLSYLLPAGSFERVENAAGQLQVVPGSFEFTVDAPALSPLASLTAVPKGLTGAHQIIFLLLIIGGAVAVLRATGTLDAVIGALLRRWGDRPFWLVAGGTTLFALGSSTIGFGEEYFPFVPVLITLALALGYDRITAVGII
ncbi:MAG TPA: YfcC family protein, partial [Armatimonadota bacterium]|nr:YfcC family protein [Armatimonadota bacterium]